MAVCKRCIKIVLNMLKIYVNTTNIQHDMKQKP